MSEVCWDTVSQCSFKLCPDEFIGIELWGIAWKGMGMESGMAVQELPDEICPVDPTTVPQQNHAAPDVAQKVAQELEHLRGADVFTTVEADVESDPLSLWGYCDRRDGRDLGPAAGGGEVRRVASGSPRSGDGREQKKSRLIQEDQMGSKPCGLFLYAATRGASNNGWLPRFAPGPFFLASGSSNPVRPSASSNWRWSSVSQNALRSPPRSVLESTDPWGNQSPEAPLPKDRRAFSFALGTTMPGVRESAWEEVPRVPFSCRPDASALRNLKRHSLWQPPSGSSGQTPISEWREPFAFATCGVCHEVSCFTG